MDMIRSSSVASWPYNSALVFTGATFLYVNA